MARPRRVAATLPATWEQAIRRARGHWGELQHRNGYYLMLNGAVGAAAGTAFWLVLVRGYHFDEHDVGLSVALISLATAVALVAKGGLDAALVRYLPSLSKREALALLRDAVGLGVVATLGLSVVVAMVPRLLGAPAQGLALALVPLLASLLMATWLQDAYFLAAGEARLGFYRNVALHGARLLAPAPVVLLGLPYAIPLAWGVALAASSLVAIAMVRALPMPPASSATPPVTVRPRAVPPTAAEAHQKARALRAPFVRSALRNAPASAAEFVPGLMLVPLVLHLEGPAAAAWFGIAWAGASALFLVSAAIARSAFAEMSRWGDPATCLRRGARQMVLVLVPATTLAILAAPVLLGLFGQGYAANGLGPFVVLAASVAVVAPVHLYLALLRARDARGLLVVMPVVLLATLFLAAPMALERWGLAGAAVVWAGAHAPWAALAVVRLHKAVRVPRGAEEVAHGTGRSPAHGGGPHLE